MAQLKTRHLRLFAFAATIAGAACDSEPEPLDRPAPALQALSDAAGAVANPATLGVASEPPSTASGASQLDLSQVSRSTARLLRRGERLATAQVRQASTETLVEEVAAIAEANTGRRDNLDEVLDELLPRATELGRRFAQSRPPNELALTAVPWKTTWDNVIVPDIDAFQLDRQNSFQVVEDGFYYNITNLTLAPGGSQGVQTQYFLKGLYAIGRPPSSSNAGAIGLNAVELEFAQSVLIPGLLPEDRPLIELVDEVEAFVATGQSNGPQPVTIPGPEGQTGELFNLYVDEELRITIGLSQSPLFPPVLSVFRKVETAAD